MEYKVIIYQKNFNNGHFNFNKLLSILSQNMIKLESLEMKSILTQSDFDGNLIFFCENNQIDKIIIDYMSQGGFKQKDIIDDKIAIFEKNGKLINFVPIEVSLDLLHKIFKKDGEKRYFCFHTFGLAIKEIENRLKELENIIPYFEFNVSYDHLVADIFTSYKSENSDDATIDECKVLIAQKFTGNIFSENALSLPQIIYKMLSLRGDKIAICENITRGTIVQSLLSENENFLDVLDKTYFEKIEYKTSEDIYNQMLEFSKKTLANIRVLSSGKYENGVLEFIFALAVNSEIFLYKNTFKATKEDCIVMAKNSLLYHLSQRLRKN